MQHDVRFPRAGMQGSPDRIPRHAMRAEALGLPMRHPLQLVTEPATLRELSAGRPIRGVGHVLAEPNDRDRIPEGAGRIAGG